MPGRSATPEAAAVETATAAKAVSPAKGTSSKLLLDMMPADIGFCHDTVADSFRNGKRILDSLMELIHGTILLKDIPHDECGAV